MSELFLVLSDAGKVATEAAEGLTSQPLGRGHKHRLEDDQMSVQSTGSKRQDISNSAEKNKGKNKSGKPQRANNKK